MSLLGNTVPLWGTTAFPVPLQLEDWPQHGADQVREEARGLSHPAIHTCAGGGWGLSVENIGSRSPKEETRAHRTFSWGPEPTFHEANCLLSFILIHSPTHFHTWVNSLSSWVFSFTAVSLVPSCFQGVIKLGRKTILRRPCSCRGPWIISKWWTNLHILKAQLFETHWMQKSLVSYNVLNDYN